VVTLFDGCLPYFLGLGNGTQLGRLYFNVSYTAPGLTLFFLVLLEKPLLFIVGVPGTIFYWVSGIIAYIGILTHSDVEIRFDPLNYIFNPLASHRRHHSTDLREDNKNYRETLVVFDLLIRTFSNSIRRPPAIIGIHSAMPETFLGPIKVPVCLERISEQGGRRQRHVCVCNRSGTRSFPAWQPATGPAEPTQRSAGFTALRADSVGTTASMAGHPPKS
jgi:hypothetical protein